MLSSSSNYIIPSAQDPEKKGSTGAMSHEEAKQLISEIQRRPNSLDFNSINYQNIIYRLTFFIRNTQNSYAAAKEEPQNSNGPTPDG